MPSWPLGFGGNLSGGQGSNAYGNFPGFGSSGAEGGGVSTTRYNFPNGWFVGGESGGMGLRMNGINQAGAFGSFSSLYYEGVQFGYNFKSAGGSPSPITIYAGFDTPKYNPGIGGALAPFDSPSSTLPGYSAHAGIEYQPAPNVSLSLGLGYTQQSGDINSLVLPGASPYGFSGRR